MFQDVLTINLENHCWLEQDTHNVSSNKINKIHLKKDFSIIPLYWLFHCFCNRFQDPTSQLSLWNQSLFGELIRSWLSSFHSVHGIHTDQILMEIKKNEYWRWIAHLGWLVSQITTILALHSIQRCCQNFSQSNRLWVKLDNIKIKGKHISQLIVSSLAIWTWNVFTICTRVKLLVSEVCCECLWVDQVLI